MLKKIKVLIKTARNLNAKIARRVMEFHVKGFTNDFFEDGEHILVSFQSSYEIVHGQASVKLIDQYQHKPENDFRYLHSVETTEGEKGLLLSRRIRTSF